MGGRCEGDGVGGRCGVGVLVYDCSPLGLVFSAVLDAMPSCVSSRKVLKYGYVADMIRQVHFT